MRRSSQVRSLNSDERQWVIDRVATAKFVRELCARFERLKVWIITMGSFAAGTMAWVRSDDISSVLRALRGAFGMG